MADDKPLSCRLCGRASGQDHEANEYVIVRNDSFCNQCADSSAPCLTVAGAHRLLDRIEKLETRTSATIDMMKIHAGQK